MTETIRAVCIQMKTSLILGGYAVIVIDHIKTIVDFDVVHENDIPEKVIVEEAVAEEYLINTHKCVRNYFCTTFSSKLFRLTKGCMRFQHKLGGE